MVVTDGEIHISELRACKGMIESCGLEGDDESAIASSDAGTFSAELALPEAGIWTVVAWVHVDGAPYVSDATNVTVE
jgi:hypothetical protein